MNRTFALSSFVLLLAAAGATRADDITVETTPFKSTASRAEVVAQMQQFRQSGVNPWADDYNQLAHFQSTRTRAEVQAEYIADRAMVAALNGEDGGALYMARREAANQAVQIAAARR
jgi:hypothetical protein